jgi:beta-glucosidase
MLIKLLSVATHVAALAQQPGADKRAADLCGKMTHAEKLGLLAGTGWGKAKYVGFAKGVARLGVPDLHLNDGPQGFRCNGLGKCPGGTSTQYPSGLTIAATWSQDSALAWGSAMGKEFHQKGANVQLGPGLCLARVPQNGRNFEYMSGE